MRRKVFTLHLLPALLCLHLLSTTPTSAENREIQLSDNFNLSDSFREFQPGAFFIGHETGAEKFYFIFYKDGHFSRTGLDRTGLCSLLKIKKAECLSEKAAIEISPVRILRLTGQKAVTLFRAARETRYSSDLRYYVITSLLKNGRVASALPLPGDFSGLRSTPPVPVMYPDNTDSLFYTDNRMMLYRIDASFLKASAVNGCHELFNEHREQITVSADDRVIAAPEHAPANLRRGRAYARVCHLSEGITLRPRMSYGVEQIIPLADNKLLSYEPLSSRFRLFTLKKDRVTDPVITLPSRVDSVSVFGLYLATLDESLSRIDYFNTDTFKAERSVSYRNIYTDNCDAEAVKFNRSRIYFFCEKDNHLSVRSAETGL